MSVQPAPRIRLSRASTSVSEDDQQLFHERAEVTATEEELWVAMTLDKLVMLRRHFIQPRGWTGRASLSDVVGEDVEETRLLTRPQFIDAITTLLETERFEGVCGIIFDAILASTTTSLPSISTSSGVTGTQISSSSSNISSCSSSYGGSAVTVGISWGGLISYLAAGVVPHGRESDPLHLYTPTARYTLLTHNKREGVAGVTICCRKKLLIVGSRGSLAKTLHRGRPLQHHQQRGRLHLDSIPGEETQGMLGRTSRKTNLGTWVVEVRMVEEDTAVIAASSSTLHFVDTSSSVPQEILRITQLPALPTCIDAGCEREVRWISVGDDTGTAHLIRFSSPVISLLTRSRSEGLTVITWQEMYCGSQEINGRMMDICIGVKVVTLPSLHNGNIRQITFHPPSSSLVTCSSDPRNSLVIRAPDHNTKTYTFAIPKGVRVFSAEWHMHVIVTGSSDGRLRIWNPYVPEAPLTALPPSPSRAPPVAVLIWTAKRVILACDADAVVRLYGLENGRCIQTVKLDFPGGSSGLAQRPLTLLPTGHLIVACRDYLATINPALRPRSSSKQSKISEITSIRSDLSSDGESDIGEVKSGAKTTKDFEQDDEEDDNESEGETEDDFKDAVILSSEERKERMRMRKLVRQGATFCCLKLYDVSPPTLPIDLPLPPRLANLGLTPAEPLALLAHLPMSSVNSNTATPAPRSAPTSARSISRRGGSSTPRGVSRPPSARRSAALKSPRPTATPNNQSEVLGSRKHLSPGWRPQQSRGK